MAVTYTTKRMKDGRSFSASGNADGFTWSATTNHQVLVTDPADSGFHGSDIDELDVIANASIPIVNGSAYTTVGGDVAYFLLCRKRTIKRDDHNSALFHVNSTFEFRSSGDQSEGDVTPQDPPVALTSISPIVTAVLEEGERVLYEDKAGDAILTPTGNYFAEPTMERFPVLKLTIQQYESSLTYQQMLDRKFTTNDATYRTKAAGSWLITDVRANEVTVELSGGPTTAVLAEYDVVLTERDNGWKETKVLVDTHYLDGAGTKLRFIDDDLNTLSYGFIKADGTKQTLASGPIYASFEVFDSSTYSSFLQA